MCVYVCSTVSALSPILASTAETPRRQLLFEQVTSTPLRAPRNSVRINRRDLIEALLELANESYSLAELVAERRIQN